MKEFMEHGCARVAVEDLLLYAYGEGGRDLAEHVRSCGECRAYLESLQAVRDLTAKAEPVMASSAAVARIAERARQTAAGKPAADQPAAKVIPLPWHRKWAPALAVAAVVVMMIVGGAWLSNRGPATPETAGVDVPEYLADVSSQLRSFQAALDDPDGASEPGTDSDEWDADPGVWDWVAPVGYGLEDLEDGVADVETSFAILGGAGSK